MYIYKVYVLCRILKLVSRRVYFAIYKEGGYKWSYFVRGFYFRGVWAIFSCVYVRDSGIDWFKYKISNIIISNHIYLRKAMSAVIHTFLLIKSWSAKWYEKPSSLWVKHKRQGEKNELLTFESKFGNVLIQISAIKEMTRCL